MISFVRKFVQTVLPGVIRPLRVLWNEIIGFVFLVFAVWASGSVVRNWRLHDGSADSFFRVGVSLFFAVVMGIFAVGSFRRARKISRT
jgi:glycerol uptake facilitator-like aquaporin